MLIVVDEKLGVEICERADINALVLTIDSTIW